MKNEWMLFDPPVIYGNGVVMQTRSFDKNDHAYDFGDRIALLNNKGFVFDDFPETWLKYNTFTDSAGNGVFYASEDLIVTK